MTVVATVSASGLRPALGQFRVVQADQSTAGILTPGGPALRVVAGPVLLKYAPPPNDPVLREFSLSLQVTDRSDLRGASIVLRARPTKRTGTYRWRSGPTRSSWRRGSTRPPSSRSGRNCPRRSGRSTEELDRGCRQAGQAPRRGLRGPDRGGAEEGPGRRDSRADGGLRRAGRRPRGAGRTY